MFQLISVLSDVVLGTVNGQGHEGIGGAEHNVVRVMRGTEHNNYHIFNAYQELWT